MEHNLKQVQLASEAWTPSQLLTWAFNQFGSKVAIFSAFGIESIVLIDIAQKIKCNIRVLTIDTGFLYPETYDLMDRVENRYGIKIEKVYPRLSAREQERIYGAALWSRDPDQCCYLRKIEPLKHKASALWAWIAGVRRDQTSSRAAARKVEWDARFGLIKINPLADWQARDVWNYIHEQDLPYNPLHDRNYPSIGCTHCTRRIEPGEDPRAGRWPQFSKKECGLHVPVSRPGTEG